MGKKSLTMIQRIIYLLLISVLLLSNGYSQIREVTSRAEAFKNYNDGSSHISDYSGSDDGVGSLFLIDLFVGMMRPMVKGIHLAQQAQLQNSPTELWRTGLELKLDGGINFSEAEFFDSQMIRGNYGLFSTQLRRFNVNDVSGAFTTIDWQVVQLNLINTERVRWLFGGGVSHEYQVDQSHFEWGTEFYASFYQNKLMPSVSYRKSGDGYPREEFSTQLEYRPFRDRSSEFAFRSGYVHQMLYDVRFDFFSMGMSFYLK